MKKKCDICGEMRTNTQVPEGPECNGERYCGSCYDSLCSVCECKLTDETDLAWSMCSDCWDKMYNKTA